MDCSNVFHDYLVQCPDGITVNAILTPNSTYKWQITDKFGKQYSGEETTDNDGHFIIPLDELPEGFLTQYAGEFKLEIFEGFYGEDACVKVGIPIAKYYDAIVFEVKGGTAVKDNLGCAI